MTDSMTMIQQGYITEVQLEELYDAELEPYASLFLRPLTTKKSPFSEHELERMCQDPHHSPRLILYLIDYVRGM